MAGKKKYTYNIEDIKELRQKGFQAKEIAKKLEITEAVVKNNIKKLGIHKGTIQIDLNQVQKLLDTGLNIKQVSDKLDVPYAILHHRCRKYNLSYKRKVMPKRNQEAPRTQRKFDLDINTKVRLKRRNKAKEGVVVDIFRDIFTVKAGNRLYSFQIKDYIYPLSSEVKIERVV